MIKNLKAMFVWLFVRCDARFPRTVTGHAYCVSWYLYLSDQRKAGNFGAYKFGGDEAQAISPAEGKIAFNHYRCGIWRDDKRGLIDGLIPAIRIDGMIGLYKVTRQKYRNNRFYDGATWDDGCMIDLQYVKAVPHDQVDTPTTLH